MSDSHRTIACAALPEPPLPARLEHWALLLDVDGTLLEFQDDPAAVAVPPALHRLLPDLHRMLDGALALVSGRTIAELDALFGHPWAMAGLHGMQLRHADGERRDLAMDPARRAHLRQRARVLADALGDVQLEDKGEAIALHCRRHPERFPSLLAAATELADTLEGYELQAGNLVTEIKPEGMDKGRAVDELLGRAPFRGRRPVYLGDDLTDEHAFATVRRRDGLAVRIGDRTPSAAGFTLSNPAAVQHWLGRVRDAFQQGAPPHARRPEGDFPGHA